MLISTIIEWTVIGRRPRAHCRVPTRNLKESTRIIGADCDKHECREIGTLTDLEEGYGEVLGMPEIDGWTAVV